MKHDTYKSIMHPKARIARHPKFARPLAVKIVPPPSFFLSRRGFGLCRISSGSVSFISSGIPHCAGDGASEYWKNVRSKLIFQRYKHLSPFLKAKTGHSTLGL